MAHLTKQEREALLKELTQMTFNKAKGKLSRMDPKGRLVFFRNTQQVGRWETRFDLPSFGIRVTLIESQKIMEQASKFKPDYDLVEVVVEPLAGNHK